MGDFVMPSLGADMDAGTLLEWHVQAGDPVERGQAIALIETEKAAIEVEVFETGVVAALLVEPGTRVSVGTPLARIEATEGAAPAEPAPPVAAAPPAPAPPLAPPPLETPVAPPPPPERRLPTVAAPSIERPGRRLRVTPLARRVAERLGVALEGLTGSGVGAAVTRADVEAAAAGGTATAPAAPLVPAEAPSVPPARGMRDAIAAAMTRSKREIPHYYLEETIDLVRAMAWLEERNEHRPAHDRMLPVALLLRAVALAATEVPTLNGTWQDGGFVPDPSVHLGVAISLRERGLIAPAILDAQTKGLEQTMAELRDLGLRARRGGLRASELSSATITVTSLGDQGVERVYGVIHPPQVAIVGFGKVAERPWARDGMVGAHPLVSATLAADHRASDGYEGARFLATVARLLQEPEQL